MKLATFVLSTALFFTALVSTNTGGTDEQTPPEQCAEMYLEILDIGYQHMVQNLEYEKNVHLYNAAATILERNSLMQLHSDDPEKFANENTKENDVMRASVTELSRKIMGNESVLTVLANEMSRLRGVYDSSSCGPPETVLEFAPAVCERIVEVNRACKFMNNMAPKLPSL